MRLQCHTGLQPEIICLRHPRKLCALKHVFMQSVGAHCMVRGPLFAHLGDADQKAMLFR